MPVRMEKDDPKGGNRRPQDPSNGGNPLAKWLPLILLFVFKKPKIAIPILIIAGLAYFLMGGNFSLNSSPAADDEINASDYSLGASFNQAKYDTAQVFAALATSYGNYNQIPSRVTLEQYAPRRRHQGKQGSCVGWASAYSARTILQARATGQDPNRIAFSPAYLYNQIHLDGCEGAYMLDAMKAMRQNGAVPFNEFTYTDQTCSNYPDGGDINRGRQFTIKGYNRLTMGANNYKVDVPAIKQNLAQGAPVVIGMMVGGTFMSRMMGQKLWRPTSSDYAQRGFGGHAMTVIGYDDNYQGGSLQIMNSWGEQWGDRGNFWMRYQDFEHFTKEAYGLHPMGSANETEKFDDSKIAVEFGLLNTEQRATIPLRQINNLTFRTAQAVGKGDKFKVLIANSIECNMYIFGQETDGSSYVLFPYTDRHSPYCGITGTRLFPQDFSMVPDEIGNRDYIAIVISKEEIDYRKFNYDLNRSRQSSYAGKLQETLAKYQPIRNVQYESGNTITFSADRQGQNTVGMVIEIDKR